MGVALVIAVVLMSAFARQIPFQGHHNILVTGRMLLKLKTCLQSVFVLQSRPTGLEDLLKMCLRIMG